MAQFARPSADVAVNSWRIQQTSSAVDLWDALNETVASEAEYISSKNSLTVYTVALGTVSDPASSSGHTVRVRLRRSDTATANVPTILLKQGATTIATVYNAQPTSSFVTHAYTLSGAEANAITDYSQLRLEFASGATGNSIHVSWAELEVPNPPQTVSPSAIAGAAAVGTPTIEVGLVHPSGIASAGAFGTLTIASLGIASQGEIVVSLAGVTVPGDQSLGGALTDVDVQSGIDNNLFDDVTIAEALTGKVDYRVVYVVNTDLTANWHDVRAYVSSGDPDEHLELGVAVEDVDELVAAIADETTAPAGVTFSRPTDYAGGLQLNGATGLAAGQFRGLWIRRTIAPATTATAPYLAGITVEGV